jgi:hypothetical protein
MSEFGDPVFFYIYISTTVKDVSVTRQIYHPTCFSTINQYHHRNKIRKLKYDISAMSRNGIQSLPFKEIETVMSYSDGQE